MFSGLSHLACSTCDKTYGTEFRRQMCECGSPLFVQYDMDSLKREWTRDQLAERKQGMWRYHELLPVTHPDYMISMNEVMTPLITLPNISQDMDVPLLLVKDESVLPTGTFKARGASVGISRAKQLGVKEIALATNGNAGAAWAAYAVRAGMKSLIAMPTSAPRVPYLETCYTGADVRLLEGTIAEAGIFVADYVLQTGAYEVSTFKEPYRLEGKKTIGFELAEQLSWKVPDVIVFPTGGGAGVVGIYKALVELQSLGWIEEGRFPKMVVIQAEGCAPLVRAYDSGEKVSTYYENAQTIAYGMRVPKSLADAHILSIIAKTQGIAYAVSDADIRKERQNILRLDGFHACPEGAAALAGVRKLREIGFIKESERVISINTGSGLKYVDQIDCAVQKAQEKI